MITTVEKPQVFDIGGIYKLELVKTGSGYCGEYTILKSGATYSFDGTGMTRRKILQKFWDRAKKVDPNISNKGGR
ncbi:hypothetical protein HOBO_263 [Bacillus phage Hobo]|uniref:Uncharacterized protein n=2 Tax=Caeruleovirus BM15 TaxID=1985178 RepID=A0A0S2MU56_9CAUD|nr:hypothetical protein FD732_gp002 [Bacillus phage BM15]YP_009626816.1 hypothetical protein FD732_gp078 [Bacillus phage BM15]AXQ66784.1 hypothetical protein HOBO_2 [Bacillus phage Hobo]ALO79423.1 hypothetical protein BM10_2 [Bacillus phage BM15]ALO79671.1 hypothetical protein BM10_267 [Bacillus phage BM15]AXQ67018.1 hypothetical protein HOBO_263 [Bacillus phage Hobo]